MKFSSAIIDLLIKGHKDIIVGPYANAGTIQAKITSYNKTHLVEVQARQQRLLLVDPETLKTTRVWRVILLRAYKTNKELPQRGRPRRGPWAMK